MTCILLHYETFQQKVALMGYLCYNYNDRVCASRKGRTVMKKFKTTGLCNPSKNYMVDITERLKQIKVMIDNGDYFTINRARQFGKTTTLAALERYLKDEYNVVRLDFQRIGDAGFKTEEAFVKSFSRAVLQKNSKINIPKSINDKLLDFINRSSGLAILDELFYCLIEWCSCSEKPIVLIIDEVDSASNNQVFLDFLAQLRLQYLDREDDEDNPAFQSVILAGVADIKHIKGNIRNDNDSKVNSPWNISADFNIDMSLSANGIKGMLDEYEADHNTGMNTKLIADSIYEHTSGYPFLVSRICQIIDEQLVPDKFDSLNKAWTKQGFNEAIKILLSEKNSLFQSLTGKLTNYPDLKRSIRSILMEGTTLSYSALQESISQMEMYGFIKNNHNTVAISNRIFDGLACGECGRRDPDARAAHAPRAGARQNPGHPQGEHGDRVSGPGPIPGPARKSTARKRIPCSKTSEHSAGATRAAVRRRKPKQEKPAAISYHTLRNRRTFLDVGEFPHAGGAYPQKASPFPVLQRAHLFCKIVKNPSQKETDAV